jgi:hypothetical protein
MSFPGVILMGTKQGLTGRPIVRPENRFLAAPGECWCSPLRNRSDYPLPQPSIGGKLLPPVYCRGSPEMLLLLPFRAPTD